MRLAWCDKIAAGLLALIALALLLLGMTADTRYTASWAEAWLWIVWFLGTHYVLPLWLFLRFIDLIGGGPWRRRGNFTVQRLD